MEYSANPIFLQIISERYDCSMTRWIVSYRKFPSPGKLIQDPGIEIHNEIHEKLTGSIPQVQNYLVTYSTDSAWQCDLFHRSKIMLWPIPQIQIMLWPSPQIQNHIVTFSTDSKSYCDRFHRTFFIRLYSTDARLSWDQFQCILMDIVTLSTDTNDCDLRHQCISEIDLHLCTWAQCCSGNGHNFLGPIPHCSMANSTATFFCDLFQPLLLVWPIPQMQVGLIPNLTLWPIPELPLGPIPFRHCHV